MKKLMIGLFVLCFGLGMVSCGDSADKKVTVEEVLAKAKAESANWDEAQWKDAFRDMMKAVSPMFDYLRDIQAQMKEAEKGDDAAKAAALAKLMEDAEAKQKEFEPMQKALDEFDELVKKSPVGKKVSEDKEFEAEMKKEFNLPDEM